MLFGAVGFLLLIVGIYSVFRNRGVVLTRGIEVPNNPNVRFHSMITVRLGNNGEISNVINNTGGCDRWQPARHTQGYELPLRSGGHCYPIVSTTDERSVQGAGPCQASRPASAGAMRASAAARYARAIS